MSCSTKKHLLTTNWAMMTSLMLSFLNASVRSVFFGPLATLIPLWLGRGCHNLCQAVLASLWLVWSRYKEQFISRAILGTIFIMSSETPLALIDAKVQSAKATQYKFKKVPPTTI